MPSPIKSALSDSAPTSPSQPSKKRKLSSSHELKTEEESTMEPPPLEKLTVDLTAESDKENKATASDSSAHSLSPPSRKADQLENDDEEDGEEEEEEESSSDDDDNPLFVGLSKEEKLKMKQKMGLIQDEFEQHSKIEQQRRCEEIQKIIDFNLGIEVDTEMAAFIDELVEENNDNLVEKLEDEGAYFLQSVKEMMEQRQHHNNNSSNHNNGNSNNAQRDDDDDEEEDYQFSDDDEDWVEQTKKKKAARAAKRKNVAKNTNQDGSKRCGRLLLNDALQDVNNQTGWSDARKKAWTNRKTQQNAYFYRFNVPGQPQKNGKWTNAEHELFMKRVLEFGVNDQWGIFSKKIPGRVGYQCSNYWRGLVKDADVSDPNYHYDGKKLHFKRHTKQFSISAEYRKFAVTINRDASGVFKDLPAKHPKHPSEAYCKEVEQALAAQYKDGEGADSKTTAKKKKNKRKRKKSDDDDEDGDDEEWSAAKPSSKRRKRARRKRRNDDGDDDDDGDESFYCKTDTTSNYDHDEDEIEELKDFVDIMTGMKVSKPAISPHGHVLGYDTWTKVLRTSKHKNVCPFTLQPMTRRSLVKLTKENYAEYKHQIINITQEQMQLMGDMNKDD